MSIFGPQNFSEEGQFHPFLGVFNFPAFMERESRGWEQWFLGGTAVPFVHCTLYCLSSITFYVVHVVCNIFTVGWLESEKKCN